MKRRSFFQTFVNKSVIKFVRLRARQRETSTSRLPGQTPGIRTFEDWIVQIPTRSGQNGVQMPYPIVGFVGQMLLFKNNCSLLLSSLIGLVYKHANKCFVTLYMGERFFLFVCFLVLFFCLFFLIIIIIIFFFFFFF